jgi:hypothetical protein
MQYKEKIGKENFDTRDPLSNQIDSYIHNNLIV